MDWTRFIVDDKDIVPQGAYKGKHRNDVEDWYIESVCSKRSKYFSYNLAKFFADEMMLIIRNKQAGLTVQKHGLVGVPTGSSSVSINRQADIKKEYNKKYPTKKNDYNRKFTPTFQVEKAHQSWRKPQY
jgi:hypothetical protein